MLKIDVVAPVASASVSTVATVKPGLFQSVLAPNCTSCTSCSSQRQPEPLRVWPSGTRSRVKRHMNFPRRRTSSVVKGIDTLTSFVGRGGGRAVNRQSSCALVVRANGLANTLDERVGVAAQVAVHFNDRHVLG